MKKRRAPLAAAGPPLGDHTWTIAYRPLSQRAPARAPSNWPWNHVRPTGSGTTADQLAPGRAQLVLAVHNSPRGVHNQLASAPPTRSGARSTDWFGTTNTLWRAFHRLVPESPRSKNLFMSCASRRPRTPALPAREVPGLERRRRWSHRTRARAQAACHRHFSPTERLDRGLDRWRAACAERAEGDQRRRRDGSRHWRLRATRAMSGTRSPACQLRRRRARSLPLPVFKLVDEDSQTRVLKFAQWMGIVFSGGEGWQ